MFSFHVQDTSIRNFLVTNTTVTGVFGVRDHADDDENADKLKEKAEMAIQAKGWLSNVVRVLYTIRWQKILMTWMECFLILCRGISSLSGVVSQTTKLFQKKKSMKMEFTANTLGLDIKREEVEDNKYTLCKVVLTKRMNAQIDEDDP